MLLFDSKIVLMTGSGSGIGQAACRFYTPEGGANVAPSGLSRICSLEKS